RGNLQLNETKSSDPGRTKRTTCPPISNDHILNAHELHALPFIAVSFRPVGQKEILGVPDADHRIFSSAEGQLRETRGHDFVVDEYCDVRVGGYGQRLILPQQSTGVAYPTGCDNPRESFRRLLLQGCVAGFQQPSEATAESARVLAEHSLFP